LPGVEFFSPNLESKVKGKRKFKEMKLKSPDARDGTIFSFNGVGSPGFKSPAKKRAKRNESPDENDLKAKVKDTSKSKQEFSCSLNDDDTSKSVSDRDSHSDEDDDDEGEKETVMVYNDGAATSQQELFFL
jgi:hypothetical protein